MVSFNLLRALLPIALLFGSDGHAATGQVIDSISGRPVTDATITLSGQSVRAGTDGVFTFEGRGELRVRATGYRRARMAIADSGPSYRILLKAIEPRALFLSLAALDDPASINRILHLARSSSMNALVIDVKAESGEVALSGPYAFDPHDPVRTRTRAAILAQLLQHLQDEGLYVIARIAVFKDHLLARKHPALSLKTMRGLPFRGPDGILWTDPRIPEVQAYNVAVARSAALAGFDEIQFDYVRFPSRRPLPGGLRANDQRTAINEFLSRAREALAADNVFIAADVFGFAAWDAGDTNIGQNLEDIAARVDYVSLMLYPSAFREGLPGVPKPLDQPGRIVSLSLHRAQQRTGLPAKRFRPWLQAFRDQKFDGRAFGRAELDAQIAATEGFGANGWMLWQRQSSYNLADLPPARDQNPVEPSSRSATPDEAQETGPNEADFVAIAGVAKHEIAVGNIPGAVILVGSHDRVFYRAAFGHRVLGATQAPMTTDTIFDLASLTKVIVTTTAVMQLADAGTLDLLAPVSRYWPAFANAHGNAITIRDLLTHHSGLPADIDLSRAWSGYEAAMAMILAAPQQARPGGKYLYSDINFEILGEIVQRVSGERLDAYSRKHIFAPLGMMSSSFQPSSELRTRIAPTAGQSGKLYWGEVHDATARRMGGIAGHAGLFAPVDDVALFARLLLNRGTADGTRILSNAAVARMTVRQSPPESLRARGLGWDLGGPDGVAAFPSGSYGHFGFTGSMLWVLPGADLYAIVLTNRVYPTGGGDAGPLRRAVLGILRQTIERRH